MNLYYVEVWVPNDDFPFTFEYYADDYAHAWEQYWDDPVFYNEDIVAIQVKLVEENTYVV